jgi:hypothetical protein
MHIQIQGTDSLKIEEIKPQTKQPNPVIGLGKAYQNIIHNKGHIQGTQKASITKHHTLAPVEQTK